jgi:hypothetical protein
MQDRFVVKFVICRFDRRPIEGLRLRRNRHADWRLGCRRAPAKALRPATRASRRKLQEQIAVLQARGIRQ